MKNALKRACTFYLGSWWLPPVIFMLCAMISILGMVSVFNSFSDFEQPVAAESLVNAINSWMVISIPLILVSGLGLFVSWIWVVFHKQWRDFALSLLCIPASCIVIMIISLFISTLKQATKIKNVIKTISPAAQTQGDEE